MSVPVSPVQSIRRSNSYRLALRKSGVTKENIEELDRQLNQEDNTKSVTVLNTKIVQDKPFNFEEYKQLSTEPTSNQTTLAKVAIVSDPEHLKTSRMHEESFAGSKQELKKDHKVLFATKVNMSANGEQQINLKIAEKEIEEEEEEIGECGHTLCKLCCCNYCCGLLR